jgi:hypothetical protein
MHRGSLISLGMVLAFFLVMNLIPHRVSLALERDPNFPSRLYGSGSDYYYYGWPIEVFVSITVWRVEQGHVSVESRSFNGMGMLSFIDLIKDVFFCVLLCVIAIGVTEAVYYGGNSLVKK